ncbi:universal stress protein [uncultured Corynebacterium sp.]|uniref:universal stress protein n=1 Tax=uncultured Corynebacterium sp. TaxID=159447 RepID=UPI0025D12CFE|nr:universal stress protein [uncultured Corynebacterium sp.]
MKYNSIAVGTDGSDTSLRAVRTAASLAAAYGAKLYVVSAFGSHEGIGAPRGEDAEIPQISEDMSQTFLKHAQDVAVEEGARDVQIIAKAGDPVETMLEVGKYYKVDLMVVGNKGRNSIQDRVFGSVATELTRKAHVDVVVANTSEDR